MLRCRTFPGISKWNHAYVTQFNHDDDDIKLSLLFFTLHATQYTQKLLQQKKNLWNYGNLQDRNLVHLQKNTILECCELKILHIRIRKNFPDLHFFDIFSTKWSSYKAGYINTSIAIVFTPYSNAIII